MERFDVNAAKGGSRKPIKPFVSGALESSLYHSQSLDALNPLPNGYVRWNSVVFGELTSALLEETDEHVVVNHPVTGHRAMIPKAWVCEKSYAKF